MAFDWNRYVTVAEELTKEGASSVPDAARRAAVSRAYYSIHKDVERRARDEGYREPVGSHAALLRFLNEHKASLHAKAQRTRSDSDHTEHKRWAAVAADVGVMLELRKSADYHAEHDISDKDVATAISAARRVRGVLPKL